jgi:hypothetical protein
MFENRFSSKEPGQTVVSACHHQNASLIALSREDNTIVVINDQADIVEGTLFEYFIIFFFLLARNIYRFFFFFFLPLTID